MSRTVTTEAKTTMKLLAVVTYGAVYSNGHEENGTPSKIAIPESIYLDMGSPSEIVVTVTLPEEKQ